MNGISISVTGLLAATRRFTVAAHNIANLATPNFQPISVTSVDTAEGGVRTELASRPAGPAPPREDAVLPEFPVPLSHVDLGAEQVNLLINRAAFTANVRAIQAQDDALGALLDRRE